MLAFLVIAVAGVVYFALWKRHCDFFTVAYFAAIIYFLPGFCGYTLYPSIEGLAAVDLQPQVYSVFNLVLTSIVLSALTYDTLVTKYPIQRNLRPRLNSI